MDTSIIAKMRGTRDNEVFLEVLSIDSEPIMLEMLVNSKLPRPVVQKQ